MPEHERGKSLEGKTILITGGTGSFGSIAARQLMAAGPRRVRIYSRDEDKQVKLMRRYPDFEYVLGDVRDKDRVHLAAKNVDIIFHAAALKQVPNCEIHPYEAYKTNVMGSHNVAEAAIAANVEIVIGLSTDKAVKPVNAMGISKAMMEKLFCSRNLQRIDTRFCCTRYGNVIGSRGSVVPLFLSQIKAGQSLSVTNGEMTRFMMAIDEAMDLVLHAMVNARGGEIFVRKAPACRMDLLAEAVLKKANSGAGYQVMGVRPGEKLHEVLVNEYEMARATESSGYFTIHPEYEPRPPPIRPIGVEYTSSNTEQLADVDAVIETLERARAFDGEIGH